MKRETTHEMTHEATKTFGKTLAFSLAYLAVAMACLVQWNSPHPRARLDLFAGTYFALRLVGSLHSMVSSLSAFRSRPLRQEWWALNSDPAGPQWVMALMAVDLVVFLDYGHWHLCPWLSRPALQIVGISIYLAVTFWQIWTDAYLARYFNHNGQSLAAHEPRALPLCPPSPLRGRDCRKVGDGAHLCQPLRMVPAIRLGPAPSE